MPGGTTEVNRDSSPLATGTHKWATSTTLNDPGADFKSCGVRAGLYIENETTGAYGTVATVTEDQVTIDWVSVEEGGLEMGGSEVVMGADVPYFDSPPNTWTAGDTYNIYKTATKNSVISSNWVDSSRGWKTDKRLLFDGWRAEDLDIDRDRPGRVFGPGQPERA